VKDLTRPIRVRFFYAQLNHHMAAKKQGYKSRQDESLGARRGARKSLKRNVSASGRRAMASGPRKAAGGKKYGLNSKKR